MSNVFSHGTQLSHNFLIVTSIKTIDNLLYIHVLFSSANDFLFGCSISTITLKEIIHK